MTNLFGNKDALIGSMELTFGALFVLGALIFRKSVANDSLGKGFSVIGSSLLSILSFLVVNNIWNNIKISFVVGLLFWLAGGFLLAEVIGDGEASG